MRTELFIAWRYLQARRKGFFSLLTTIIAVGGITLGVAALIITLAVMTGFHRDIRDKILGIQPHITVTKDRQEPMADYREIGRQMTVHPGIVASAPFVYGQIILRHRQNVTGAVIKGIDLDAEDRLVRIRKTFIGAGPARLDKRTIILGEELARTLGARPGDTILLMSPGQFAAIPKMHQFTVERLFHSGMFEYDATMAFVSLPDAQELFGLGDEVSGIGVTVAEPAAAGRTAAALQQNLPYPLIARSWDRMNKNLFAALKLEKAMMFIILGLIILVAAFNIVSNLLMMTMEKSREMGILSAMGFSRARIARIFMFEGLLLGISGIAGGTAAGMGLALALKKFQFVQLPPDIYYLDALPVHIVPADVAMVVGAALLITIAAAVYPALQVRKLDPVEAIRYG